MSNRLKHLREAQGLSLVGLAARVGTSSQQISHLELAKRHLTVEWLTRLAAALDCHPWTIVSDVEPSDLSDREQLLLQAFRRIGADEQKELVDKLIDEAKDGDLARRRNGRQTGPSKE